MKEYEAIACCDDKTFGQFQTYCESDFFHTLDEAEAWILNTLDRWDGNGFVSLCGNIWFDGHLIGAYDKSDIDWRSKSRQSSPRN